MKTEILLTFCVVVLVGITGCSRQTDISAKVTNVGIAPIDSVTISVTGNSYYLGRLKPGESKMSKLFPKSESHLEVTFRNAIRPYRKFNAGTYIEPGYSGTISVDVNDDSLVSVRDSVSISN